METDIVATSDGVAVHFHGDVRTRAVVANTRYSDLNTPRILKKTSSEDGHFFTPVEESLATFKDARFFFDLKTNNASAAVVRAIKNARAKDRVSIDGTSWRRTCAVAEEIPEISRTVNPIGLMIAYSLVGKTPNASEREYKLDLVGFRALKELWLSRPTSFSMPVKRVDQALIGLAQDKGIPVFLHHGDERNVLEASKIGAKGLMLDNLDILNNYPGLISGRKKIPVSDFELQVAVWLL